MNHLVDRNELTLLKNGAAYFPRLCADIDAAKNSVYLETYIYADDDAGRMIGDALGRAAARGVAVRLLLDGFGSADLAQTFVDVLRTGGIEVQWFRLARLPFLLRRSNLRRLHRKLAVIDGNVAYIGGINIVDDIPHQYGLSEPRLDYAVRLEGPLAGEVHAATRHLWRTVSWASLKRRGTLLAQRRHHEAPPSPARLLLRDSLRHRRDIEQAYLRAIAGADDEIVIANAYFLPGRTFRRALTDAARRGVRVVLLLQGRVEYRIQHYATQALYEQLHGAGIEIYEYQASHLHAKVAVIDKEWATVGSSNIDPYSLRLAREANLAVVDADFAGELHASLMEEIERRSLRVNPQERGWFARLLARLSYGLIRLAVGWLGLDRKRRT